jgi:hypothetical protein
VRRKVGGGQGGGDTIANGRYGSGPGGADCKSSKKNSCKQKDAASSLHQPCHQLTKIVTPTGTLPTNCQWLAGGYWAETGANRAIEKKNTMQNNTLKNFQQTGTAPA